MEVMPQQVDQDVEKTKEEVKHQAAKEDLDEDQVVVDESSLKRRSTAARTTSDNGSTITTVSSTSSSGESASWATELDTTPKIVESINTTYKEAGDDEMQQQEENSLQFYSNSEGHELVAASQEVAGTSTAIDWSQFNVKRDDLAAKLKDVDIEVLMNAAINGTEINGAHIESKQIEYIDGTTPKEISLKEGETVVYEVEESDEEVVELEFESAVEKIHTHDGYNMYCPNCSSRITKVVLRRKIRQRRILVASERERQDLLGCLSCFSIFIPSGDKLNPFKIFGARRDRDENIQLQEELPTSDVAVPTSDVVVPTPDSTQAEGRRFDLFWFFKRRRVDENALTSPLLPEPVSSTIVSSEPRDEAIEQAGKAREENIQLPQEQPASDVIVPTTDSAQAAAKGFDLFWFFKKRPYDENALTSPLLAAAQIQSSSTTVTSTAALIQPPTTTVTSKPRDGAIDQGGIGLPGDSTETLAADSVITTTPAGEQTVGKSEGVASVAAVGKVPQPSPPQGSVLDGTVIIDVYEKREELIRGPKPPVQPQLEVKGDYQPEVTGGEVRIHVVETPLGTEIPESADVAIAATRPEIVTEAGTSWSLDILKSIVYGGLMESITSLVVVSLATAVNATTMNVVGIGLAYLVGGLVLLVHSLRVLRYGHASQTSEQRYQEQLGRKERFPLHASVAVVSCIIFGLIPPVIYGFTFRETDDREFKMLAVAAASFLCIVILAIGQAYVRGQHRFLTYFKTVLYYVILAAIASGAAFGIGYLVKDPFPCPAVLG